MLAASKDPAMFREMYPVLRLNFYNILNGYQNCILQMRKLRHSCICLGTSSVKSYILFLEVEGRPSRTFGSPSFHGHFVVHSSSRYAWGTYQDFSRCYREVEWWRKMPAWSLQDTGGTDTKIIPQIDAFVQLVSAGVDSDLRHNTKAFVGRHPGMT